MSERLQRFARNTSGVSTLGAMVSFFGYGFAASSVREAHPELKKEGADFWGYIDSHKDFSHTWGAEEFTSVFAGAFWGLVGVALLTTIFGNVGRSRAK